jgi:AraC-like DNA-binding protein/quercetin dioxygenase-like cupin family protein
MDYLKTPLKEEIVIKNIYTIHYFEYAKDYVFKGEKHNFWEFVYVDKGEIEVMSDKSGYKLKQGEMIFHKPNEFHNLWANGKTAPNLVIVSFECKSGAMKYFEGKIIKGEDFEKDILAKIIAEAKYAYSSPLDDTYLKQLQKRENPLFGSEQLIKNNLELLLITLFRKGKSINKSTKLSAVTKQRYDNEKVIKIIDFLKDNLYKDISFEDICRFSNQSKTNLKLMFKAAKGSGVMEYYRDLKIDEIKRLIREEPLNFTDIAAKLSYTSVHYFSRHFKKSTGMTPTEYATSVKAKE